MVNETTGDICEIDFKARGVFSTSEKDKHAISAVVKQKDGKVRYTLTGKYSGVITATEVSTGRQFKTYECPKFPEGP